MGVYRIEPDGAKAPESFCVDVFHQGAEDGR
jgi:hypothetical protein